MQTEISYRKVKPNWWIAEGKGVMFFGRSIQDLHRKINRYMIKNDLSNSEIIPHRVGYRLH